MFLNDDGTWHYALDVPRELNTGGEFDFRSAKWGMDRATVGASEATPVHSESGSFLIRRVTVADIEAFAGYLFDDEEQLNGGTYLVLNGNADSSNHVEAYKTIHGWLEIEFGKPETVRTAGCQSEG